MSKSAGTFRATVNEDGSYSVLGRLTSLDGTGDEQAPGEGPVVKQADVSSVACHVYDLGTDPDGLTGTEVTPAPTLSAGANVFDTLRTAGWPTDQDPYGYNFRHDLSPTYTPAPDNWYQVEYTVTLTSGGVIKGRWKVKTVPVIGS